MQFLFIKSKKLSKTYLLVSTLQLEYWTATPELSNEEIP